jgi:hypothetical protein
VVVVLLLAAAGASGNTNKAAPSASAVAASSQPSTPQAAVVTQVAPPVVTPAATPGATVNSHVLTVANVTQSLNDNKSLMPLVTFENLKVTIEPGDEVVDVEAHPTSVLDEHAFLLEEAANALVASKAIFGWYPSVQGIRVTLDADFTDQYGHSSTATGAWIIITAATAHKFDYAGMAQLDATTVFCDANSYYVDPAIWKGVGTSDRGCMTAPSK